EELGIKVVYDWIVKGDDEFNQKMNVSMASEDLPDVMCVTSTQMMQLIDAGLVQEMGPVFEQYATDFTKEVMYQEGDSPFLAGNKDGVQYGLPVTGGSVDSVDLMWIRTDWLEKLNLEVPSTMDEVMNVIDQFVNADFDGNGQKDTIGIGVAGTSLLGGGFGGLRGFFNAYGAYPGIWVEKDGQLVYGAIQPECKTALAALHEMYEKGYIDAEFGVKIPLKPVKRQRRKCGFSFGQQWLSLTPFQSTKDNDSDSQWSAYPLPSATGEPSTAQADWEPTDGLL
ncbi:MAG: extracellular solute-binding protein, partial [Eisenbergiella sp.]